MPKFENIEEAKAFYRPMIEADKKAREEKVAHLWENLNTFVERKDVPDIPITRDVAKQRYYAKKLIEAGAIPRDKLIDGAYYLGAHRCARVAQWQRVKNKFKYWKWEFTGLWDYTNHFEDDDGFALFVPIREVTKEDFEKTTIK